MSEGLEKMKEIAGDISEKATMLELWVNSLEKHNDIINRIYNTIAYLKRRLGVLQRMCDEYSTYLELEKRWGRDV